ncbi:VOC family protein [Streptomyces rishiriensis]|uniref:VOC family protein n=1 Tax=Streptomyces rishiriensis TaxID=68264 RepID=UPI00379C00EC
MLHHVELWVPDLSRASREWGWLLGSLAYELYQEWERGRSWRFGATYLVIEESSAMKSADGHDRLRPGLNHLAFHAGNTSHLDALVVQAPAHGWVPLFADKYPHAGGPEHYAAYLENSDGFEVELVAGH